MHLSAGQTGRVHDKKCKVFERSRLGLGRVSHLAFATHYQQLSVAVCHVKAVAESVMTAENRRGLG